MDTGTLAGARVGLLWLLAMRYRRTFKKSYGFLINCPLSSSILYARVFRKSAGLARNFLASEGKKSHVKKARKRVTYLL